MEEQDYIPVSVLGHEGVPPAKIGSPSHPLLNSSLWALYMIFPAGKLKWDPLRCSVDVAIILCALA